MQYVILMLVMVIAGTASASPLDCEGLRDADRRNYCRAVAKQQKTYCEFIKDHDLRFTCRAAVK